jgi:DNA repair protein RadD
MRILNVTHVAELVEQNLLELLGYWPWADAGAYSAGLGRRQLHNRITFAGIQSIWNKAALLGRVDLLIVDEAHTISRKGSSMWGKFIAALRELNPDMRIIGFTASPFRLDSGMLHEGDDKMFDDISFELGLREAIEDGYLKPLISKATATTLSTAGVKKAGGEWVASALQEAVDRDELTIGIVDDMVAYGTNRKSWLVFASGVKHATHLRDEIRSRGVRAEMVTGETPSGERKRINEDFKAQRIRALVNVGTHTTGFNAPSVDLIAAARPTESAGLLIQMAGRGTRPVYAPGMPLDTREQRLAAIAAGPCPDCLFLDFGGLIRRHGPIDLIKPRKPGKGGGDAPVKACPECFSIVHASATECPDCGFIWERQLSAKITKSAAVGPILSKSEQVWRQVSRRSFFRHEKFGAAPSVRIEYWANNVQYKEWVPFENEKARGIAANWWKSNGGPLPTPTTVTEALERAGELQRVAEIRIEAAGRYWKISGRRLGGDAEDVVVTEAPVGNFVFGRAA